jgi:hypothetical protein
MKIGGREIMIDPLTITLIEEAVVEDIEVEGEDAEVCLVVVSDKDTIISDIHWIILR